MQIYRAKHETNLRALNLVNEWRLLVLADGMTQEVIQLIEQRLNDIEHPLQRESARLLWFRWQAKLDQHFRTKASWVIW